MSTQVMRTVPEVAERLRCAEWTVRDLARKGDLRGSHIAGRWLFEDDDVQAYIDAQANRPAETTRRRRRRSA